MKMIKTFNFDVETIAQLKRQVRKGYHSQFVNRAVKDRLDERHGESIMDIPSRRLLLVLTHREDIDDTMKTILMAYFEQMKSRSDLQND